MKNVSKDLAVAVVAHITGEAPAEEEFPYWHEGGVLAVCHRAIPLQKEWMAGIKVDCIIGILPPLGKYDLCLYFIAVETEKFA